MGKKCSTPIIDGDSLCNNNIVFADIKRFVLLKSSLEGFFFNKKCN